MTLVLPEADRRRRLVKRILFIGLPVLLIAGGAYYYFAGQPQADAAGKGKGAGRLQPVSVAEVKVADVPIWITALGTAVPRNLVTVHTRVDGELMKLHFREGQMVKQGELLAELDPRPFEVQLTQANGQLVRDTALLQNARVDLERYKDLWAKDSIAKQQLDTQDALVRQYEGTVENDRGTVENARLQLTYARVVAPASGRIGLRQVDPGNVVHAGDANGLIVIAQLQPMTVVFSMPETYLPAINRRIAGNSPIVVEAWDREQKNRLAAGRLLTTDNLVDTTTGTIKMKAEFANSDNILFPNQFANVRLLLGVREKATVVPGAAILRGSKGPFVYTVDSEGTVTAVPITPGPEDAGLVAVEGPLKSGDRVVADGADKLRDGAKVEVITPEARAKPADGAKKPGTGGKRPGGGPPRPSEGAPPPAAN
jgi:multidrug efflux system membrane fusion protein